MAVPGDWEGIRLGRVSVGVQYWKGGKWWDEIVPSPSRLLSPRVAVRVSGGWRIFKIFTFFFYTLEPGYGLTA
jgi:hypothetical protein